MSKYLEVYDQTQSSWIEEKSEGGLSSPRQIREGAVNDGIYTSTIIFEQLQSNINLLLYHNSPVKT